ncbi:MULTISPECIES: putative metal-binding motif-containing protein [unclassified Corallococcus]|uniref:putative metal-binding motif-containing protein n=1 Tax=unclassified Corallococcus TaxID=2685029 RepID=UPI0022A9052B|nr:putative metal-binding motif-containing protein [Corallococcus sp. NCRR]WAS83613.1 putative metal-binding motif-containing protein [Corallococcus sp. NCRR]
MLRVTVKYVSLEPRCVRVQVGDGVHEVKTDVPSSEFQDKEFRLAMVRKPDWKRVMDLTVTAFSAVSGTQCTGTVVEVRQQPSMDVPPGTSDDWSVTLRATDMDGDGYFAEAPGSERPDCDDSNPAVHPNATESCGSTVDLDCNQLVGCQEANCRGQACDDGDACTTGEHCEGSGLEAKCVPSQTTTCPQPTGICDARQACNPNSGLCEPTESTLGRFCDDGNLCTTQDVCMSDGKCAGAWLTCTNSTAQCLASSGTCNPTNGQCVFTPLPNTTSCQDNVACTTADHCDGNGECVGVPSACTPPPCYRVKQVCSTTTECEYEVNLNGACTTSGGMPGVCLATAECSAFPYRPYNFDPNAVAAADIGEIKTNSNVTFNTADQSWYPANAISTAASLRIVSMPQQNGNPPVLLIPVKTLELNGTLRISGPSPVILAVYGDVNLSQSILASGSITNPTAACGASQGGNGTYAGKNGGGGGGAGNGTPGVAGGKGYNNSTSHGSAGTSRPSSPEPLLGGCPGGTGGGNGGATAGMGGAGGGAIQLSVARNLTISKAVGAGGFGGQRGSGGGGGGGGSGGRVVLEAFQLTLKVSARVTANGGGGGEGGSTANDGNDGANGSEDSANPANGGAGGNVTGGDGGAGGTGTSGPVNGTDGTRDGFGTEGSGGGGGGAAGYIHLRSVQSCSLAVGHVLSPPPSGGCLVP